LRRLSIGTPSTRALAHRLLPKRPAPGCVLIRFFSADGRLGAVRTDAHETVLVPDLAPLADVARDVRLFHYQMEVLGSAEPGLRAHRRLALERARRHLDVIAARVLEPVLAGDEPPREVRIAPHDVLARVPWHALPLRGRARAHHARVSLELGGP